MITIKILIKLKDYFNRKKYMFNKLNNFPFYIQHTFGLFIGKWQQNLIQTNFIYLVDHTIQYMGNIFRYFVVWFVHLFYIFYFLHIYLNQKVLHIVSDYIRI